MSYPNRFQRDLIYSALVASPLRPAPAIPVENMFCTDCEEQRHACKCGLAELEGNRPPLPLHG